MPHDPDDLLEVYHALRHLAQQRLAAERPDHTLQATALVHEVYLKLAAENPDRWNDPAHFFHVAAQAMRRALIDHARTKSRQKRGGPHKRVPLIESTAVASLAQETDPESILALDIALTNLETINPEAAAIVRLRFYAGLSVEQIAQTLNTSPRTVKRKWVYARAWLFTQLTSNPEEK